MLWVLNSVVNIGVYMLWVGCCAVCISGGWKHGALGFSSQSLSLCGVNEGAFAFHFIVVLRLFAVLSVTNLLCI